MSNCWPILCFCLVFLGYPPQFDVVGPLLFCSSLKITSQYPIIRRYRPSGTVISMSRTLNGFKRRMESFYQNQRKGG
ncbi:unnamed protein product [Tuwongella immobilis]|uniref:Uncharacterized protein n=1 Tax=Tuwongella immobilis TaxID=692036 RepID=A0A6C2YK91_9BACT|nr:unnamed protein product [Tuwongella immobilis]VTR98667.1 unnamed protein product [Tuwongella immobilis]